MTEFDCGMKCIDVLEESCEGGGTVCPKHEDVVDVA